MDIIVKKLNKAFGDKVVLSGFDFTVEEGSTTVVMGKSGIGKTTLLNCIAKLIPYEGEILGVDGVSYVFQEDRLINHLTVYGNLDFSLSGKFSKQERVEKIKEVLIDVELQDKASSYPSELSGGQKKRVALARAFLSPEKVLLMDEPMNSLDLGLKDRIFSVFNSLKNKYFKTVVFVTHDLDEALTVADKIVVINEVGEVYSHSFEKGERDITSNECNEVRKELLKYLK